MRTSGLFATVDPEVFEPPRFLKHALVASAEMAEEVEGFTYRANAVEENDVFIDEALLDLEQTREYLGGFQATLESIKEIDPERDVASLEASLKAMAIKIRDAIMELIRKAKEHVLRIWKMYTDRTQIIHRKATALRSKLEGKTFTPEESDEIAQALVENHSRHVWNFSVDKGNQLVIHPNQTAFFKKYVDKYVDTQEADKKMTQAIIGRLKNQVKHIDQGQDLDTDLNPQGYATIIRKALGKDAVAPGGVGFSKEGVIESRADILPQFQNVKVSSLQPGLAKFASREGNFIGLMDFILAVTKEGSTFATDVEQMRRSYFDQLQATTEQAVERIMKTKGYETPESEQAVRHVQKVVRDALEIGYRATTALHRSWLEAMGSMLIIASAYASKRA